MANIYRSQPDRHRQIRAAVETLVRIEANDVDLEKIIASARENGKARIPVDGVDLDELETTSTLSPSMKKALSEFARTRICDRIRKKLRYELNAMEAAELFSLKTVLDEKGEMFVEIVRED